MCLVRVTLRRLVLFLFIIGGGLCRQDSGRCGFMTSDTIRDHPPRKGDNGFTIFLSGDPEYYVPHESYWVTLKHDKMKKSDSNVGARFIGFFLMIEPAMPGRGGTFQPIDETMSQVVTDCPSTITHTSLNLKSEVNVRWKAPAEGSRCINFKAAIIEQKNIWYDAEGGLIKTLCEEDYRKDAADFLYCEACSEAKYEISFESLWSRQTHPKDFPSAEASFSDIIGASHSHLFQMWELGAKATEGIQQLATSGETSILEMDFVNNASYIRTIIKSRGLKHTNTKSFAVFRVDRTHHFLSILSKILPSPDWILGVSNLNLCKKDGTWEETVEIPLYPIDAGIDKGITYTENIPLSEGAWEIMRNITSSYPNDDRSPFFGDEIKPLANLIVMKKRQYDIPCSKLDNSCETTQWSPFSPCSVTCGEGTKSRKREYVLGNFPNGKCTETLVELQPCIGDCFDRGSSYQGISYRNIKKCEVTAWSEWSSCSPACGKGIRRRSRNYVQNSLSYDSLCNVRTSEEESCESQALCNGKELCAATIWTEWSPCSASCGKGMKTRRRRLFDEKNEMRCNVQLLDQQTCSAEIEQCILDPEEARNICLLDRSIGPCRGYFPRWYFDKTKRMCMQFIYGGCRGNRNNFELYEHCNSMCKALRDETQYLTPAVRSLPEQVIDCQVTEWGEWSACSSTCGRGQIERHRTIKIFPKNGGKKCPKKSTQRKVCSKSPCP